MPSICCFYQLLSLKIEETILDKIISKRSFEKSLIEGLRRCLCGIKIWEQVSVISLIGMSWRIQLTAV